MKISGLFKKKEVTCDLYETKNINTWYACLLVVIIIIFQYFLKREQVIAEGRGINTVEQGKEGNRPVHAAQGIL